jgi:hypothetical protein
MANTNKLIFFVPPYHALPVESTGAISYFQGFFFVIMNIKIVRKEVWRISYTVSQRLMFYVKNKLDKKQ